MGLIKSRTDDVEVSLSLTEGSTLFAISSDSNRVQSASALETRSYSYDAAGNTLSDGIRTFTYNDAGRMVSATSGGVTTTYTYNGLGERVKKSGGGLSRYFAYNESGHLIGEYDAAGDLIQETVWFEDIPVATLRPDVSGGVAIYYVHTDHLNTPRRVTRRTDNVIVWRWDSVPFGRTNADEDPDGDTQTFTYNLRFPGQYYHLETGLHYNYFRTYDPSTGRYFESDPIGLDGGINTYLYALANPVRYTDRFALWVKRCARQLGDPDNPPMTPRWNPFRHDYLSVSGEILSFQAGSNMFWSQGYIADNEHPSNPKCIMVCDDDEFDKYVLEAAKEIGAPTYCVTAYPGSLPYTLGARNCQTWADDVLKLAKKKYKENEQCPACFK